VSKIIVTTFLTLDGVAQAPGGPDEDRSNGFEHGGWQVPYWTDEVSGIIGEWMSAPGGLLLGRKTYEIFASHWPKVSDDHEDAAAAKVINAAPKFVASRTLKSVDWENSTLLGDDVPAAVADLKKRDLGELQVHGSIDLAQTLIKHHLVDEYRLTVFPILLGEGRRLFDDGTVPAGLKLKSSKTTKSGVVAAVYAADGKPSYGKHTQK
jgi:dihydrofolate reductase